MVCRTCKSAASHAHLYSVCDMIFICKLAAAGGKPVSQSTWFLATQHSFMTSWIIFSTRLPTFLQNAVLSSLFSHSSYSPHTSPLVTIVARCNEIVRAKLLDHVMTHSRGTVGQTHGSIKAQRLWRCTRILVNLCNIKSTDIDFELSQHFKTVPCVCVKRD